MLFVFNRGTRGRGRVFLPSAVRSESHDCVVRSPALTWLARYVGSILRCRCSFPECSARMNGFPERCLVGMGSKKNGKDTILTTQDDISRSHGHANLFRTQPGSLSEFSPINRPFLLI